MNVYQFQSLSTSRRNRCKRTTCRQPVFFKSHLQPQREADPRVATLPEGQQAADVAPEGPDPDLAAALGSGVQTGD